MRGSKVSAALVILGSMAIGVRAEDSTSANGIAFNFSTPGARSLAMGGAFLGLADDATAATTNPAGLTNLMVGGSEVAVELRNWSYTDVTLAGGHFLGPSTGMGIDAQAEPVFGETTSKVTGLSFLSLGHVLPHGIAVALYRHELANFRAKAESNGFFVGEGDDETRFLGSRASQELSIVNYGISAAHSVGGKGIWGEVSLGFGLSYYTLDMENRARFFDVDDFHGDSRDRRPGGFYGPTEFTPDRLSAIAVESGSDAALGYTAGFLWKIGSSERWSLGGVYKNHPSFATQARLQLFKPAGTGVPEGRDFHVPDILGLGLGFSSSEGKTKVALDLNRVRYSQRLSELVRGSGFPESDFRLDDTNEAHLGLEHVFVAVGSRLVGTFRLGAWWEEAHEPEYVGPLTGLKPLFGEKGQDEMHWSGGLGFVIKEDFQIDAAIDVSHLVKTVSLSLVKFL